ncbi:MAG TPA: gluconate 2-dehydrogenase subunit 3 family protein [Longimicrobiales bacterium]
MHPVLHPVRPAFRAIATTIVPEAAALDADDWAELERIIEAALATRPAKMRRQLRMLIRVIQLRPLLRYGRPFTALDPDRRTRVLRRFENARLLLLRRGFWGLRTLVFMGYYARPAAAATIGYRADPRGWEARADAAGPDAAGARAGGRTSPATQADPATPAGPRDAEGAP